MTLPSSETGLMKLLEAIGIFEQRLPKEPYFRVAVLGSARLKEIDPMYTSVENFGYQLGCQGIDVITGAGPGLMKAANHGAMRAKQEGHQIRSYGINIGCFINQEPNPFLEKEYRHQHFGSRLHHFTRLGRAFVVMDGGIGTLLELSWFLQLQQAGQLAGAPLILVGSMWGGLIDWMKSTMIPRGLIKPEDIEIPIFSTPDEALPLILEAKRRFDRQLKVD